MLMTNEYRSAYKRVHSPEEAEELRANGWTIVEEQPVAAEKEEPAKTEEPPMKAPRVVNGGKNQLMYKGKYLSHWVSVATRKELVEIFKHFGIPYAYKSSKSDMVTRLRQYIRDTKAEKRREENDG